MWFIFFKWGKCSLEKLSDLTNATWQFDNRAVQSVLFNFKHCACMCIFFHLCFPLGVWLISQLEKVLKTDHVNIFLLDAGNSLWLKQWLLSLLLKLWGQIDILKFNSASFTYWSLEMISFIWACFPIWKKGILCIQPCCPNLDITDLLEWKIVGGEGQGLSGIEYLAASLISTR